MKSIFLTVLCFKILILINRSPGNASLAPVKEVKNDFVINSAFYYQKSKFYSPNSMIIIFNANKKIKIKDIKIHCISQNKKEALTTIAEIRMGHRPDPDCLWEFFIANCSTTINPTYFALTTENSNKKVKINFEYPVQEKYPVVMCYPPMVYESRWQQIIFATEIYHYFGTDLQIQYINSAMTEIVDILKIYQAKNWVRIKAFAYIDFDKESVSDLAMNPMHELRSRNQPLAYTDCLMKYREASEFVIIADVDDVLIPKYNSFYNEFMFWQQKHPQAIAFMYYRSYAKINASNTFGNFSLINALKSFSFSNSVFYGKSVYQTKYAETAWIHTPGLRNETTVIIPPENSRFYHVQIKSSAVRKVKNVNYLEEEEEDMNNLRAYNLMSEKVLKSINTEFERSFTKFSNFYSNSVYGDIIFNCYKRHETWSLHHPKERIPCITQLQCKKPKKVSNFNCMIVRRNFTTNKLDSTTTLHVPNSAYYWHSNKNGCNILQKSEK